MATKKQAPVLAPQQVVACDKKDHGCGGGDTVTAYDYMRKVQQENPEDTIVFNRDIGERRCFILILHFTFINPSCKKNTRSCSSTSPYSS